MQHIGGKKSNLPTYRYLPMLKTVEAILEKDGRLHLLEKIDLAHARRVLVTFLEEEAEGTSDAALLSEAALAEDWNRAEEDEAWQHLQ